jgi:hypothetical protein
MKFELYIWAKEAWKEKYWILSVLLKFLNNVRRNEEYLYSV